MSWKEQLTEFERNKEWDMAIAYMQNIIAKNPDNLDAYLSINYLLMNLLVEEDYNRFKHDYYASLCKKYFTESYAKFHANPKYLFYIARIACMSEWYFDIELETIEEMLQKAMVLDPNNLVYQWTYYADLNQSNALDKDKIIKYYSIVLQKNSPIKNELKLLGALGEYILSMMEHIAKEIVIN